MNSFIQLTKDKLSSVLKEQNEEFLAKNTGVKRDILDNLKKTIDAPQVTVITGLRRVGKSTLLAQIARSYLTEGYYFVNFEDERLLNFTVQDFDFLYETLISLFGEKKVFLFDEIQNVPEWERFIRRLHDQGYKFILTGSNASLLSRELGTRLTGRTTRVELFPFSFAEYLSFKEEQTPPSGVLTTRQKGRLVGLVEEYLEQGGIPDALKYPELDIHQTLYNDVLYRDIAARYQIDHVKSLKELAFYMVSNTATMVSFNKLKNALKLGSVNTVKNYMDYMENSWLFFVVNKYAFSVREQQIAAKKVYTIDTGLAQSVGFSFLKNRGKSIENIVYLTLRRKTEAVYYYKTNKGYEVDFYLPENRTFIQVAARIEDNSTKKREVRALLEAAKEQESATLVVITESEKQTITTKKGPDIHVIPLYEWLIREQPL